MPDETTATTDANVTAPAPTADQLAAQARAEKLKAKIQDLVAQLFADDFTMNELEQATDMFKTWFRLQVVKSTQYTTFQTTTNTAGALFGATLASALIPMPDAEPTQAAAPVDSAASV